MNTTDRMSAAEFKARGAGSVPIEYEECEWLFQWAHLQTYDGKRLSTLLIQVPNGAYLGADAKTRAITMGKLKKTGLQPGCFDYILPVPKWSERIPGLWLEMKRTRGGTVSADQKEFMEHMLDLGWQCNVCKGWIAAAEVIADYLQLKGRVG